MLIDSTICVEVAAFTEESLREDKTSSAPRRLIHLPLPPSTTSSTFVRHTDIAAKTKSRTPVRPQATKTTETSLGGNKAHNIHFVKDIIASSMFHPSNTRLNAAGLVPEHSKLLPERQPTDDEANLLNTLHEVRTKANLALKCEVL